MGVRYAEDSFELKKAGRLFLLLYCYIKPETGKSMPQRVKENHSL